MLKLYTAIFEELEPVEFEAHSIADAKWRLRDILGVKRLPPGTEIISRSVGSLPTCLVKPKEITVAINDPMVDDLRPFVQDLLEHEHITDVATDPIRVTYSVPRNISLYRHTVKMTDYIKQTWRKYARKINRESLEVSQEI